MAKIIHFEIFGISQLNYCINTDIELQNCVCTSTQNKNAHFRSENEHTQSRKELRLLCAVTGDDPEISWRRCKEG